MTLACKDVRAMKTVLGGAVLVAWPRLRFLGHGFMLSDRERGEDL